MVFRPERLSPPGSARRHTQLLALRLDFRAVPIRGNVPTRLQKLHAQPELGATLLAAAGLERLGMRVSQTGFLRGSGAPGGLAVCVLEPELMLPCVGQGAIGLEIREDDVRLADICRRLDDYDTSQCVAAERSFLRGWVAGARLPLARTRAFPEDGFICAPWRT